MTVEIIIASVIAFPIAFFLIENNYEVSGMLLIMNMQIRNFMD